MNKHIFLFIVFNAIVSISFSQDNIIKLINPSFEGQPHIGRFEYVIEGWGDCGRQNFKSETPPDIHLDSTYHKSINDAYFGVQQSSSDGKTFLGLVTRNNGTFESIYQRLYTSLLSETCYEITIDISRSINYFSPFPKGTASKQFIVPIILQIAGGNSFCNEIQLLAETSPIDNTEWRTFTFTLEIEEPIKYLIISAAFDHDIVEPYNGNILLDNISALIPVACKQN